MRDQKRKNMQNEPNFKNDQMNVTSFNRTKYEKKTLGECGKNKPNSNPNEPKTNPIKANSKPEARLWLSLICFRSLFLNNIIFGLIIDKDFLIRGLGMKIAYFDCFAGAAGDMIVAAMLDAGLDIGFLKKQLATLKIKSLDIKKAKTKRCGISAVRFSPAASEQTKHRNLKQIKEIINKSKINDKAKAMSKKIFERLARAEAVVHGKAVKDVHFHELGALDTIVDIVSACIGLDELGIEKVYSSALSVGGGTVDCAHGKLPVPAPATAVLIKNVPVKAGPTNVELLTPTGAAILTTITDEFSELPEMQIEAIGYGAGTLRSDKFPNVLRLFLGKSASAGKSDVDSVCLLETNIDDSTGELIGALTERLFDAGAVDVFTTPVYMKHNRPAVRLSVICNIKDAQRLERLIFEQGVTLGVRRQTLQRSKLRRKLVPVKTRFGRINIKTGYLDGRAVFAKPEFVDCRRATKRHNVSTRAVSDSALAAYNDLQRRNNL